MPITALKQIGIDINTFSPEEQAELRGLSAKNILDASMKNILYKDMER